MKTTIRICAAAAVSLFLGMPTFADVPDLSEDPVKTKSNPHSTVSGKVAGDQPLSQLKPVTLTKKITLQGEGLFGLNSDLFGNSGQQVLLGLVNALENLDDIVSIEVVGHTDSSGSRSVNREISILRAKMVQAFLQGAYPEVPVSALGKGESNPLHPNSTEQGRALNRRVEVNVSLAAYNNNSEINPAK